MSLTSADRRRSLVGVIAAMAVVNLVYGITFPLLAAASTAFTTCRGVGTVIGPLLVGLGMDWLRAQSLAMIIFVLFVLYLPLPVASWIKALFDRGDSPA